MKKYAVIIMLVSAGLLLYSCGKKEKSEQAKKQKTEVTPASKTSAESAAIQQAVKKEITPETAPVDESTLEKAPDFTLTKLDGSTIKLSELQGKVVILDFWATWCPPCRKMIPELINLYQKYKDQGLEVVGISLDEGGTGPVQDFVNNVKITYPVVMGTRDISKEYGYINAIPTSFVIDRKGYIRNKHVGYISGQDMEQIIQGLIAQK